MTSRRACSSIATFPKHGSLICGQKHGGVTLAVAICDDKYPASNMMN